MWSMKLMWQERSWGLVIMSWCANNKTAFFHIFLKKTKKYICRNVKSLKCKISANILILICPRTLSTMQLFKFDLVLKIGERMSFEGFSTACFSFSPMFFKPTEIVESAGTLWRILGSGTLASVPTMLGVCLFLKG